MEFGIKCISPLDIVQTLSILIRIYSSSTNYRGYIVSTYWASKKSVWKSSSCIVHVKKHKSTKVFAFP